LTNRITYKPIRSDSDLIRLYKNASLLIYPSLYEGFGLPLVEAFSCGTPCATALGSCLEEVGGDAAVYFDPLDPENMASVALELLASPDKCAVQIEKGFRRASEFTWSQTLNQTHELYKKFVK
jgi:glycosyltransferase involved in cell wall biosynthesis